MINKLKKLVEEKYGERVVTVKSCQALAESIKDVCGISISDSTIRRQWNMLSGSSKPSMHTLNVLCKYIGYESWDVFYEQVSEEIPDSNLEINFGQINAEKYTHGTISYIFKKAGISSDEVVQRQFIDDQISALLDSDFTAAAIIAPGGYGKSLGIASWVSRNYQKRKFSKSIIFFINGSQIDGLFSSNLSLASWLSSQIFKSSENIFEHPDFKKECLLFLIIDALDEIDSTLSKSAVFFRKVVDFIGTYSNVKILVSARTSVWSRELIHELNSNASASQKWMGLLRTSIHSDSTNLPALNRKEIQDIIDRFVNSKSRGPKLLVDQLNFMLRETISNPYMLKLFISIYTPELLKLQNNVDLIDAFISNEIVNAKYSDEKLDILNFILQMQEYGRRNLPIKKNDLKDKYPINLRKNGNYFFAYEHLLAFSIISEETVENKFRNLVTQIDFSHSNLRDLLITRYLVEENGGVTHELFVKVDKDYKDSDLRGRLLENIYAIAYSENNFEALKDFYSLPDSITKDHGILVFIINLFRSERPVRNLLLKEYCKVDDAKRFLTDNIFDSDAINTSYFSLLEIMLNEAATKNERIYCLAGLAYSNALQLNVNEFLRLSEELKEVEPDETCGRYTLILLAIWKLYYLRFAREKVDVDEVMHHFETCLDFYKHKTEGSSDTVFDFFLSVIPHVLLFKENDICEKIFESLQKYREEGSVNDAKMLTSYDMYLTVYKNMTGEIPEISPFQAYGIETLVNSLSYNQSYLNRIFAYGLLAQASLKMNDQKKFMYYIQSALEICSNSKYNLIEISLLKRLVSILASVNLSDLAMAFNAQTREVAGDEFAAIYDLV